MSDDGLPTRGEAAIGLSVVWSKYRGPGDARFAPASPRVEPAGATGQKAVTSVTFSQPGDYVLRALVSDGSGFNEQCCWTNAFVKVSVRASSAQG
jgi:hypothetical protein